MLLIILEKLDNWLLIILNIPSKFSEIFNDEQFKKKNSPGAED